MGRKNGLQGKRANRANVGAGAALSAGGFVNGAFVFDDGQSTARASINTSAAADAFIFININCHNELSFRNKDHKIR